MHIVLRHRQQVLRAEVRRDQNHFRITTAAGKVHDVDVETIADGVLRLTLGTESYRVAVAHRGRERLIAINGEVYAFAPESASASSHSVADVATPEVVAPMPGKILQVLVKPGDRVAAGDGLIVLEAMKMETRLSAEAPGEIAEVRVAAGDSVDGGQVLLVLLLDEG